MEQTEKLQITIAAQDLQTETSSLSVTENLVILL